MSKYREFRRNFWRDAAANSFKRAAKKNGSRTWTSVGLFASTIHVLSRMQERKKKVLWRGKLDTGETIRVYKGSETE